MREIDGVQSVLLLIGDWVLLLTAVPLGLFVGFYFFKSPGWRRNFVGRTLMYLGISLFIYVVVVSLSVFLGADYFLREYIRLAGYLLVFITCTRLFLTLRYVQKNPDKAQQELRDLYSNSRGDNNP